jgi:NitT/TauT family transport system ATP-binding protein
VSDAAKPKSPAAPESANPAAAPKEPPPDPAAEAAALAAFEAQLAGEEAPAPPEPETRPSSPRSKKASDPPPTAKAPAPTATAPKVSAGTRMPPLQDAPKEKPPVVLFDKLTKMYGKFTAIKDVSFRIEDHPNRGEFVPILGPSGCGKSTVIRLIAGLTPQFPHTSGRMLVDGKPVTGPGADRGMVFQDYTSFDNRSVRDNIAFGLECRGVSRGERRDLADHWIHKVGLSVRKDAGKYPHELSGGMRQRVAIARTLILKPRIILMDEPFGALDPPTRSKMQDMLIELWREQAPTVFFITHSIEEAVFLGDHILVFSNSPGTILKEVKVPPPERPSVEMQRDAKFQEIVYGLRDIIDNLESSNKAGD